MYEHFYQSMYADIKHIQFDGLATLSLKWPYSYRSIPQVVTKPLDTWISYLLCCFVWECQDAKNQIHNIKLHILNKKQVGQAPQNIRWLDKFILAGSYFFMIDMPQSQSEPYKFL